VQGVAGGESREEEITKNFKACFDFENIEVGWILFPKTGAPSFVLVRIGEPFPLKPSGDGWKQGTRILLHLGRECGGDLRELVSNAEAFRRGLDALYDQYLAEKQNQPAGHLPIVVFVGDAPLQSAANAQGQSSTNYVPIFKIEGWTPRPEKLIWTPKSSSGNVPAGPHSSGESGYLDQGRSAQQPLAGQSGPPSGPPAVHTAFGFGDTGIGRAPTSTVRPEPPGAIPYKPPTMSRPPATGSTIAAPPQTASDRVPFSEAVTALTPGGSLDPNDWG